MDDLDLWDWRRRVDALYAAARGMQPEAGWRHWRDGRDALFRTHPQSPVAGRATPGPARGAPVLFGYDPAMRFSVGLLAAQGCSFEVPAGADGTVLLRPFARTDGLRAALDGELTLYWIEGYGGGVFLPFSDATTGRETFGGGRYLLDTIKGADLGSDGVGRTVLDFNFAYQPSCSYSDQYVCPLAPPGNRLPLPVRAGERYQA